MDGAVTGQFDNLPLHSMKMTLGILNMETRDKKHAWRSIGYLTQFQKANTLAEDILRSSEHMDMANYLKDELLDVVAKLNLVE